VGARLTEGLKTILLRRYGNSAGGAVAEILAIAFLICFLFSVISIDATCEQEAFNQGAICLVLGVTASCLMPLCIRLAQRQVGPGDIRFARRGTMILVGISFVAYMLLGSLSLGRLL
jgi:hypothetical protein